MKKLNGLSWDEYFMAIAQLSAFRSKDPHTKVGACLVDNNKNIILGTGYNGAIRNIDDSKIPWETRNDELASHTKYPYLIHAEQNAILNSWGRDINNARVYTTLFPCSTCAKLLIQLGIKEVIYWDDRYIQTDDGKVSQKMFKLGDVKLRLFCPESLKFLENEQ